MIGLVNASLCLGKFLWKFRHSFSCTTTVAPPILRFVKQKGHYHDHPVSIRWVLVLVEGAQTHLILSAIALTLSFHLVRFAASYPPTQFYLNFFQLAPPYLLWPSSISLPIHFKYLSMALSVLPEIAISISLKHYLHIIWK